MTSLEMVTQFHTLFGQRIAEEPDLSDDSINDLRYKLIREELQELSEALLERDPVAVLDALVDIEYVLMGSYLSLGFAKYREAALSAVHDSNMRKLWPDGKPRFRDPDRKVMKPPGWVGPDLARVMREVDFDDAKTGVHQRFDRSEGEGAA